MVEQDSRTPGRKLLIAVLIALALAIPIFCVWMLVYDRQSQSEQAAASITAGWGGPQAVSGPLLVIPYRTTATETVVENGQSVTRSRDVVQELSLAPKWSMFRPTSSPSGASARSTKRWFTTRGFRARRASPCRPTSPATPSARPT